MQRIRSHIVKLFTGLIAVATLILLPFYSANAAAKNTSMQTSGSDLSNQKTITLGGNGDDMGQATAVDGSGNVYISGYFNGTADFNPGSGVDSHASNGGRDVFLSKFDASGNFLWAKTWGGIGDERGESVAVDRSGNVYVSGPFQNTVDFNPAGGASHTSNAGSANNIYLSKFASDGTFQWVKNWGPSDGGAESYGIAMDGSNNVYVVGDFSGTTCDFNPWGEHDVHTNHDPAPGSPYGRLFDSYLSKFDSNGNFLWAKTWGGEGYDDGPGVTVDSLGNVYVGGMYASQSINFDPDGGSGGLGHPAHDSGIVVDVFLSKFNSSGTFQWVKTWGGQGVDDIGQTMAVDESNNVYMGGRFGCNNCDFNPSGTADRHSSNGELDAFVSKYDSNGNFQWAKTWGGTGWDAVGGLTIDSSNNVYVTGLFKNNVNFGSGSGISSNGLWDAFLSKFNSSGNFQWAKTWGGTGDDSGNKPAANSAGDVYVPGWFTGTVDFAPESGGDTHVSNGGKDAFLSTFKNFSTLPIVTTITRVNPNPTNLASADFTVIFSESVTGVDASDFSLATSGILGAAVSGVGGSGSVYTVTINTGSGSGTIQLNVIDNDSILNGLNIPLGGSGAGNGDFMAGEIYTITRTWIFGDVPDTYWSWSYIERLYNAGITGGCSQIPLNYCPNATVTRAQMAIFLLKGIHGSIYSPPAVGADTGFADVATDYWAAPWIKQLFAEGITGGCGTGIYCPEANVSRAQMAIFLLKAKHGSAYLPPNASGVFTDVPVNHWARNWIEQLAAEAITSGCGAGIYCPEADVSRAQMAVFLVKTFNLP